MGELEPLKCQAHNEEVKLYCIQCPALVCWMCLALNHRNHECQEITEAGNKAREAIAQQIETACLR
jgi:hypothetical protein